MNKFILTAASAESSDEPVFYAHLIPANAYKQFMKSNEYAARVIADWFDSNYDSQVNDGNAFADIAYDLRNQRKANFDNEIIFQLVEDL